MGIANDRERLLTVPARWRWRADIAACLILLILWAAFFWRFLTPVEADRVSLAEGDFSGQFVAFGAYQAARLWGGEVPLWDPYNNGGLPFLADTQAAVFYPPRLLTVALTGLTGQWTYHALELEMMGHVLAGSFFMYWLMRRMTAGRAGSIPGALAAALTWSYGGFMTGYPPLQLALLEAVIWAPLIVLGVYEATRDGRFCWHWLVLSGAALGLSVMAGHSQTNFFLGWLLVVFLAYRVYACRLNWKVFVSGVMLAVGLAAALALVQLLPAYEYLQHATRIAYGFDDKSNGFPIQDVIQLIFPRVLSVWSPLYVGIVGVALAGIAIWRRISGRGFWGGVALIGLLFSFGGNAALYGLVYNFIPGLRLFRGQERAAMLIALSLSILVGLGMTALADSQFRRDAAALRILRRALTALAAVTVFATLVAFVLWLGPARDLYSNSLGALAFSMLMAGLALVTVLWFALRPADGWRQAAIIGLIVFDLFTVGWGSLLVDPVAGSERLLRPPVTDIAVEDGAVPPARVDGQRGVLDNHGTLWGIPDIRGISPLWLQGPYTIIGQKFPNTLAWELFSVRYVFSDWQELPVPGAIVAEGADRFGPVNAHLLADPRPFALLMDDVASVDSDEFAYALLADPRFDPRHSIILDSRMGVALPDNLSADGMARVTAFVPENIEIALDGLNGPAVLSIALPQYPGWRAEVDGRETPILRAYGALSALIVPEGARIVSLIYDPLTFRVGAAISLAAWGGLLLFALWMLFRRYLQTRPSPAKGDHDV